MPGTSDETKIAELLCTRLCHDLTGPIGAVNNGAEFLSEEGFNMQSQALELIVSSAFSAVSRLQFYRMAYGRVKEHGEASLGDSQKLANDYFTGTRTALDWPDRYTDALGISVSQRMVRLLFNLLIIASAALLKGGGIAVSLGQEAGATWMQLDAHGESVKWEPEVEAILLGAQTEPLTPKNVQIYHTRRLAAELGAELSFQPREGGLVLRALRKAGENSPPLSHAAAS